ncbi:MAG: hypothetical protein WAK86_07690, partial [Pseudonocardiaceae bacterium]
SSLRGVRAGEDVLGRLARRLVDHLVAVREHAAAVVRCAGERKDTKRAIVTLSPESKPIEIFGGPAV